MAVDARSGRIDPSQVDVGAHDWDRAAVFHHVPGELNRRDIHVQHDIAGHRNGSTDVLVGGDPILAEG